VRACICYRFGDRLRKLVWFNESTTGIFLGYYGEKTEHHHSLHKDGSRHLRDNDGRDLLPKVKDVIIDNFHGYRQLLNASIALPSPDSHSVPFAESSADTVTATLHVPAGWVRVSMDYYLLHRSAEDQFLRNLRWPPVPDLDRHEVALCLTLALDHFPDHKVALVVFAPIPATETNSPRLEPTTRRTE
jgi:hypothetical protein